ncbi:magnesium/cobalt transporter CorA [Streptomyces sp. NPDC049040]|uniref:magnesium/cobalt transporter CorA n=1 Tax=Streptomyces sp. NPDC049040 TaxID=3365593 RepID=UPI003716DEDF
MTGRQRPPDDGGRARRAGRPAATEPDTGDVVVDCAVYVGGVRRATLSAHEALRAARAQEGGFVWIGLHEPGPRDLEDIADTFGLHPLAVEDAVHAHQRPKLEQYEDTLFLVLKTIVSVEHEELTATSEVVDTGEIMIFLGVDFIVVVRHGSAPALGGVRRSLEERPDMLAQGPAAVLHAIADQVVDDYLDVADAVELDVEQLESDMFAARRTDDAERIYQLKRELLEFRRAVLPLTRPLMRLADEPLPAVPEPVGKYLRDVADHLTQVRERLTAAAELTDGLLAANLARVGVQQNTDMRRISATAAILAIPTLIAAIYGMNFDHMPELHWIFGYPLMLAVTAAISYTVYRAFRRNGWL